jgi:hypothetical protein
MVVLSVAVVTNCVEWWHERGGCGEVGQWMKHRGHSAWARRT